MPEQLREDLQKKSEASRQTMPSRFARLLVVALANCTDSQLPTIEVYHSLVALDTSHHKSTSVFGYPSWVYKATSSKNGKYYCLRRLEG
jgi:PAB-dependent poly(A)-specific ribonuclease subunit 3